MSPLQYYSFEDPARLRLEKRLLVKLRFVVGHEASGDFKATQNENCLIVPLPIFKGAFTRSKEDELNTEDIFNMIRCWTQTCEGRHPRCKRAKASFTPKRLIDVRGTGAASDVHLIISPEDADEYLTLSYCWGKSSATQLKTTTNTVLDHINNIPWHQLPPTFQEAITVVRKLGKNYLWIDSLCIIQDDVKDWETEGSQMGKIYENSFLNLAAAGAWDSSEGLFIYRSYLAISKCFFQTSEPEWEVDPFRIRELESEGPLSRRHWTLQESNLAPRSVYFHRGHVIWVCREGRCTDMMEANHESSESNSEEAVVSTYSLQITPISAQSAKLARQSKWYQLVEEYCKRDITNPGDILPAIWAISQQHQKIREDVLVAGLWRNDFLRGLLFERGEERTYSSHTRQRAIQAPSWSWAYRETDVRYWSIPEYIVVASKMMKLDITDMGRRPMGRGHVKLMTCSGRPPLYATRYQRYNIRNLGSACKWSKEPFGRHRYRDGYEPGFFEEQIEEINRSWARSQPVIDSTLWDRRNDDGDAFESYVGPEVQIGRQDALQL
jgi:hypothetical protein